MRADSLCEQGVSTVSNDYSSLRELFEDRPDELHRCAAHMRALRQALAPVRDERSDDAMLLATWNIREFDGNARKFGPHKDESLYYIAEVLSAFDLIAVQEINRDLRPLRRVIEILGHGWDYLVTDATEGMGGNDERMAFIFNTNRVFFRKIAGEVVLPGNNLIVASEFVTKPPEQRPTLEGGNGQFARSPFLVAFQSGWFKFSLCTVHIYYGEDTGAKLERRIAEIETLVEFFADRQDGEIANDERAALDARRSYSRTEAENYILLGDFNVISPDHRTAIALRQRGFEIPAAIDGDRVREQGAHYYDQIAVRVKDDRFQVETGGMFNVYHHVYRDDEIDLYRRDFEAARANGVRDDLHDLTIDEECYRVWRTYQMSDHNPLWVKIRTDFADRYLGDLAEPETNVN